MLRTLIAGSPPRYKPAASACTDAAAHRFLLAWQVQYYPALPNVNYIVTDAQANLTSCQLANETVLLFEALPNKAEGRQGAKINQTAFDMMVRDGRVFPDAQKLLPEPSSYISYDAAGANCTQAKEAFASTARVA